MSILAFPEADPPMIPNLAVLDVNQLPFTQNVVYKSLGCPSEVSEDIHIATKGSSKGAFEIR